jgi:hypothetical protein
MTDKDKSKDSPYIESIYKWCKPMKMKEWAIKQLRSGSSPNKVSQDIKKLFGEYVSMMTVYRWKKRYVQVTGENIPTWRELNKTVDKKNKNKHANRVYRNTEKQRLKKDEAANKNENLK